MLWLYNLGIFFYGLIIRLLAPFNHKAKLFTEGRKNIFRKIEDRIDPSDKHIWFHFASLGEFEQGRPVLEKLKAENAEKKIVVTFFSPSGYEIRKNYPLADGIFYLPLDTRHNALKFIKAINPELAIFTKYEFWHHYFQVLHENSIPLFLISGIFRPGQIFFKSYGGFYRKILKNISHFFVQNQESRQLLAELGISNVSIAGDTRFDRVFENAANPKDLPEIEAFCASHKVFIAGSSWPQDEQLIAPLIRKNTGWKFILAPHEINAEHLSQIQRLVPDAVRYSEKPSPAAQTLIIDNMGMLSSIYRYANIAYIGGGFGAGIHNTLEAAAFGVPILFGPHYHKFQEAKDLLELGAAISIQDQEELEKAMEKMKHNTSAGQLAKSYVEGHQGATNTIYAEITNILSIQSSRQAPL